MGFNKLPANRIACHPIGVPAFDQLLGNFFGPAPTTAHNSGWTPRAEVVESAEGYTFAFEIPGLSAEDISITVEGDKLTISGEKTSEERTEDEKWHLSERAYGSFRRTFTLPHLIGEKAVHAEAANGVLTVTVKKAKAARSHQIEVKSA